MKTTLLTVLLFVAPAWADSFPTDLYFYTCNSGVIDCNAFPKHWYGDFGMNGLRPVDARPGFGDHPFGNRPPTMIAFASNINGEVIGVADGGVGYDAEPVYGHGGVVYCLFSGCTEDNTSAGLQLVDINNLGFWIINDYFNFDIGTGTTFVKLVTPWSIQNPADLPMPLRVDALGINDLNQILVRECFDSPCTSTSDVLA